MTHIGNGPGPGRNYGETAVFTICRSVENTQNPSSIWKKVTFFFAQLCPVVARPWFRCKRERFFGPKNSDFGSKIRFHPWPVDFAPSDLLCDFLFPRNSRFRKKKNGRRAKKALARLDNSTIFVPICKKFRLPASFQATLFYSRFFSF